MDAAIDYDGALALAEAHEHESDLKRNILVNLEAKAYRDQREIDLDLKALAAEAAAIASRAV